MVPRTVTLALVDRHGRPLGLLPLPRPTPSPWWQQVDEVVDLARETRGVDVTVLRLLAADGPFPGGAVTYVAEYDGPEPDGLVAADWPDWTAPHPLRMPWARPGGPAATIEWATRVLAGHGRTVLGRRQCRTWNLSSIWRLATDHGPAWVKEVPPFFAHEGTVLRWLDRPSTPVVLGVDGCRLLLEDIPGADQHHAGPAERVPMLLDLLEIQADAAGRLPELFAIGVPDLRAQPFRRRIEELAGHWPELAGFADGLPGRFAELAACGVPDTLVHGDFHPGNVRSDGTTRVLIDWGDSVVGHPALDLVRMRDWANGGPAPELTAVWCGFWRDRVPGCRPERAVELMAPFALLRNALVYGDFTRSVEPAERRYHEADAPGARRDIVALLKTSREA